MQRIDERTVILTDEEIKIKEAFDASLEWGLCIDAAIDTLNLYGLLTGLDELVTYLRGDDAAHTCHEGCK